MTIFVTPILTLLLSVLLLWGYRRAVARAMAASAAFDASVPAMTPGRCLLVVDDTTDDAFLKHTLTATWDTLSPASPNCQRPLADAAIYRFSSRTTAVRAVLRRLCEASTS